MTEETNVVTIENESTAVGAVNDWESRLAKFAVAAVAQEAAPAGSFISVRAGVVQYAGQAVAGNKLDVIAIDSIYENTYYTADYDPDSPASPVCFAFAHEEGDLKPHPDSVEPQHSSCKGCPQNEFGTAERGRGKACKNSRRLALLPASPLAADALGTAEVAFMKLPVTSVKNWGQYVNTLATMEKRPPFAVVTTIGSVPDTKTQFKITFDKKALINDGEILDVLVKRQEGQMKTPTPPYQASTSKAEKPAAKGKGKF
jgi:hypothetical protein